MKHILDEFAQCMTEEKAGRIKEALIRDHWLAPRAEKTIKEWRQAGWDSLTRHDQRGILHALVRIK